MGKFLLHTLPIIDVFVQGFRLSKFARTWGTKKELFFALDVMTERYFTVLCLSYFFFANIFPLNYLMITFSKSEEYFLWISCSHSEISVIRA